MYTTTAFPWDLKCLLNIYSISAFKEKVNNHCEGRNIVYLRLEITFRRHLLQDCVSIGSIVPIEMCIH